MPGSRLPALGAKGQGWVVGQMLLIFVEGLVSYPAFNRLPPDHAAGWISFVGGAALLLAGGWLVYRGIVELGDDLTAMPAPVAGGHLVQTGIYARLRHPIYAGVMALAAGWAFLVVSPPALVVALLLAGWLDLKARREEAWLLERYAGYQDYRARTPRFLPNLY